MSEQDLPSFDDPEVQIVYRLLCDYTPPPDGQHWEGFDARRIVAALRENVMEMALCESISCVLRIGQLYRFVPVGDCKTCASMKAAADEAYGPSLQGEQQ
jgi:hypothetical protein